MFTLLSDRKNESRKMKKSFFEELKECNQRWEERMDLLIQRNEKSNMKLRAEVQGLRQQNGWLSQEVQDLKRQNEKLEQRSQRQTAEIKRLRQSNKQLQKNNKKLSARVQKLEQQNEEQRNAIRNLQNQALILLIQHLRISVQSALYGVQVRIAGNLGTADIASRIQLPNISGLNLEINATRDEHNEAAHPSLFHALQPFNNTGLDRLEVLLAIEEGNRFPAERQIVRFIRDGLQSGDVDISIGNDANPEDRDGIILTSFFLRRYQDQR